MRRPLISRILLASVLSLALNSGAAADQATPPQASQRPMNVVLLVIDDARWDSFGAAGNRAVHTPTLDQLAAEGVRFRQAMVTTSICWVSRATLLTGQYMSRHGVVHIGAASMPGSAAAATARPGPSRIGGPTWNGHEWISAPATARPGPTGGSAPSQAGVMGALGRGARAGGSGSPAVGLISPEAYAKTFPALMKNADYWTGFVGKWNLGGIRPTDWDFARPGEGRHWVTLPDGEQIHVTEKNARDALEFLRARPKDKPFLLDLSFFAAHADESAKEQYLPQDWSAKFYEGVEIPPPLRGDERYLRALPPFLSAEANEGRRVYSWRFDGTPERYQDSMKRYYRLITEVDDAIRRVVDELKAQGVYENTLILYIGDNGYFQADRGLGDKWYPYEESIRVPLIIRDPRLTARRRGQTRDEMALNIDVAPTILAATGLATPDVMQGKGLSPLYLQARVPAWRDEFFYEHPTIFSPERLPSNQAVVRRDWKYVYWPDFNYEQLFDLKADPGELRNLASDPAHTVKRSQMKQKLEEWRQRVR